LSSIYLDRNLGEHVIADALRAAGAVVKLHDDYLAPNAPDEGWIDIAGVLVKAKTRIQRFVRKSKPPFVARIDRSGQLSMYDL
jgi:hypothetical protein